MIKRPAVFALALVLLWPQSAAVRATGDQLAPTVHPALPTTASELWLVPTDDDVSKRALASYQPLVDGATRYAAGDYAAALPLVSRPSLASTPLADYAGVLHRPYPASALATSPEARAMFHALTSANLVDTSAIGAALRRSGGSGNARRLQSRDGDLRVLADTRPR